jgi:hypothetical protein
LLNGLYLYSNHLGAALLPRPTQDDVRFHMRNLMFGNLL